MSGTACCCEDRPVAAEEEAAEATMVAEEAELRMGVAEAEREEAEKEPLLSWCGRPTWEVVVVTCRGGENVGTRAGLLPVFQCGSEGHESLTAL